MKKKQNTEQEQINEFVDAFIQNPFTFMLGANMLQQMFSGGVQGDDPEFEKWLEDQDNLPNAAEELQKLRARGGGKMTPEQLKKLSPESQKALSKALSKMPDGLEKKIKAASSKKATFAFNEFVEDYDAFQEALFGTLQKIEPAMKEAGVNAKGAAQIKNLIYDSMQPSLEKVETLIQNLKNTLSKDKDKKDDAGKKNIKENRLTSKREALLAATLSEEEPQDSEDKKKSQDPEDERIKAAARLSKEALGNVVEAITFLKKSAGSIANLMKGDAFSLGKDSAKWVEMLNDAVNDMEDSISMARQKIEKSLLRKTQTLQESATKQQKFYESFGDFS